LRPSSFGYERILPLHIQRSLEQRWAAKFASPVASAAPKGVGMKVQRQKLAAAGKKQKKNPLI
jgi:hypothetical protein